VKEVNTNKAKSALRKVAAQSGMSFAEVRRETQLAIAEAMANPDAEVRKFWEAIPRAGIIPTPEELITYIAGIVGEE